METDAYLWSEQNRKTVYEILSTCYFQPEESPPPLKELKSALEVVCTGAVELVEPMLGSLGYEARRLDYAKLFLGPYKLLAPPYGSLYLEGRGQVMGDTTVDVKNRYHDAGLEVQATYKEPPDHIAVELEFVGYLIFKKIEALTRSDEEAARAYLARERSFLANHLAAWVPEFARAVEANAETAFYRSLAGITSRFLTSDVDCLARLSASEHGKLAARF